MTATFAPRACPEDAWKTWMKQGWELVWRGRSSWWAIQAVALSLMVGVTLIGGLGWGLMVLAVPLWGMHLALAESLASGRSSFSDLWRALLDDALAHGRSYLIQAVVRQVVYLFLVMVMSWIMPSPTSPAPVILLTPFQLVMISSQVWLLMWGFVHVLWMQRWLGFEAQLSWKARLPFLQSTALNHKAVVMNQRSFFRLRLWMAITVMVGLFIPFALLLIEPFWAAVNRCAYAEIFDQNPGLQKEVESEVADSSLVAVPM